MLECAWSAWKVCQSDMQPWSDACEASRGIGLKCAGSAEKTQYVCILNQINKGFVWVAHAVRDWVRTCNTWVLTYYIPSYVLRGYPCITCKISVFMYYIGTYVIHKSIHALRYPGHFHVLHKNCYVIHGCENYWRQDLIESFGTVKQTVCRRYSANVVNVKSSSMIKAGGREKVGFIENTHRDAT